SHADDERRTDRRGPGPRRRPPGEPAVRSRSASMTATLLRLAFSGIRSRLLASSLTILLAAAAAATLVLALQVGDTSRDPWQRTFDAAHGAHVLALLPTEDQ